MIFGQVKNGMTSGYDPELLASKIAFEGDLERILIRHTALLCWNEANVSPIVRMENNGTCCFLQTPEAKFIVTNAHVWDCFEKYNREHTSANLWLSLVESDRLQTPVHPLLIKRPEVIAKAEALDLITITFAGIERLESWRYWRFGFRRAKRVSKGDQVFFIGYSGDSVKTAGRQQELGHDFVTSAVADVGYQQFVLHDKAGTRHFYDQAGKEISAIRACGLSGSPVFHVPPLFPLKPRLVGFVSKLLSSGLEHAPTEAIGKGSHAGYEMADGDIYITHADVIRPNGSIQS